MISMKSIITDWDYIYKNEEIIGKLLETPFFEKCVHLCWQNDKKKSKEKNNAN
jgi:hypothetical protein